MNNQDIDEVAKHKKKKNNSSRSEKKADHKHEYQDCLLACEYNWSDKYYIHKDQYCVICGKINAHYRQSFGEYLQDVDKDNSAIIAKYPNLPVFHLQKYIDGYVDLQEAQ